MQQDQQQQELRLYSPEDMPHFRDIINNKMDEAKKELAYLQESIESASSDQGDDNSAFSSHMAESGSDSNELEKLYLLAQRQHQFIRNLEAALQRMKNGTYGFCRETGKPIEFKRLEAVPHATMSIAAKRKLEAEKSS